MKMKHSRNPRWIVPALALLLICCLTGPVAARYERSIDLPKFNLEIDGLNVPGAVAVTKMPTQTIYSHGEQFDPAGMVVTVTYTDGTSAIVTDYTLSAQVLVHGQTEITISYTENEVTKTCTQPVTVEAAEYEIIYKTDGGAVPDGAWYGYSQNSVTYTLPEPTKENYTFAGWYWDPEFTSAPVTQIDTGSTGNVALYAKWEAVTDQEGE